MPNQMPSLTPTQVRDLKRLADGHSLTAAKFNALCDLDVVSFSSVTKLKGGTLTRREVVKITRAGKSILRRMAKEDNQKAVTL